MTVVIGRRGWLNVALESTPGVPVPPTSGRYIPFLDASLDFNQTPLADMSVRGIREDQSDSSVPGKSWGGGNLKLNLDPILAPYFIGMALGTFGAPSTLATGVYSHALTVNETNTPKSATIILNRVTDQVAFPYSVVNSLDIQFSDGLAEMTVGMLSKAPVTSTSGTVTTVSGALLSFKDAVFQTGANITAAQSGSTLKIREFQMNVKNNSEAQYVAGSRTPDSIIHKNLQVSGSFRLAFEDTTQYNNFVNTLKQAIILTFTGRGIGGGFSEKITFNFYKVRLEKNVIKMDPDNYVSNEIEFIAEYSSGDSAMLDCTVINQKSSYSDNS